MNMKLNNLKLVDNNNHIKQDNKIEIKKATQNTIKYIVNNTELKQEMVKSIVIGQCSVPEDLVKVFDITYDQAIHLLNDSSFIDLLNKYSKAKLNLFYKGYATNRLTEIARSDDNKESIQAIKLIAQVSDNLKTNTTDVSVNLNLETLVRETEKVINPEFDIEHRNIK